LWRPSSGFPSKNVRFQSMGQFHLSSNKNAITGGAALTAIRRIMILSSMSIMMESPCSGFLPSSHRIPFMCGEDAFPEAGPAEARLISFFSKQHAI
jgi:hypothetical protein